MIVGLHTPSSIFLRSRKKKSRKVCISPLFRLQSSSSSHNATQCSLGLQNSGDFVTEYLVRSLWVLACGLESESREISREMRGRVIYSGEIPEALKTRCMIYHMSRCHCPFHHFARHKCYCLKYLSHSFGPPKTSGSQTPSTSIPDTGLQ